MAGLQACFECDYGDQTTVFHVDYTRVMWFSTQSLPSLTFSHQKALAPTSSRSLRVSQSRPAFLCSLPPPLLGNHREKWLFCSLTESVWERPYFYHLIILFAAKSVDKIVIILTRKQHFSAWNGNASYRAAILHNSQSCAMWSPVSYKHGIEESSSPSCPCALAAKMY